MKALFKIVLIVLIATRAFATNYYLSSKGNDQQSGTSAGNPWRSLRKLSEMMPLVRAGDCILFERGSVFVGELKISASGRQGQTIYVGAYGSGAKPVITGSVLITNWTFLHGNIWMSERIGGSEEPSNLFIDGQYQLLGRYPNEGYMTLSCPSTCKSALISNLGFADGFWNESEVVVKSSRWTLDNLSVSNYFDKTFYFSSPASYPLQNGYGYFIQKHVATLDQPGEWFFDKKLRRIFLYSKKGDKPGNHMTEVSLIDLGLDMSGVHFVTVENLVFKNQRKTGVEIKYCDNIKLRNCVIEYSGGNGIEINSCQHPAIEFCQIENSNNNGVEWRNNTSGMFVRNSIHRTGLHPGRGSSANGTYIGLSISSDDHLPANNLFQFNTVDSTGYTGIDFRTGGTSIVNNLVSNFCMVKDDGAGIYTWGNTFGSNSIKGNIVVRGAGCGDGTNDSAHLCVHGIYIDDRSSDITLTGNTVAYCGTNGIYIHNANRIAIHGNTLFANGTRLSNEENTQLCIKLDGIVPLREGQAPTITVAENRFVTLQEGNHCVYLLAEKEKDLKGLRFERNLYSAPRENLVVAKPDLNLSTMKELALLEWQLLGNDKSSQFKIVGARSKSLVADESTQLVYNTSEKAKTVLFKEKFESMDGDQVSDRFVLQGYSSRVLLRIH